MVLFIHNNYDAGRSAHHIIVVMNEHIMLTLYGVIGDLFEFNM